MQAAKMGHLRQQRDCQDAGAAKAGSDQHAGSMWTEQANSLYSWGSLERMAEKGKVGVGLCHGMRMAGCFSFTLCVVLNHGLCLRWLC